MNKSKNNLNQSIVWLLNEKYNGQLTSEAEKDIARLRAGEPVDYVIGYKKFLGCQIDLRYKPLIPREETEFWLGKASAEITKGRPRGGSPRAALDMFTGSGCCGIAVLKNISNSHCDFVDISDNCLKQIRLNLKINGIDKKRYRVIKSNIFEKLSTPSVDSKRYDVILANPPYIGLAEKKKVQPSVLDFEPKQALFAKDNGLFFIKKFLSQAKNYLAPQGVIYLEFGYNQKKDIEKLLKKFDYQNFEFHKDQFSKWRYLKID
ncbi:MAG: peptide chain release factor N(5)-glutamine methyltransferase [Patescibacteria group bacterium]